ncbi:MAG: hypothetical protein V4671_03920, partial [Armatimonadota bacterium]
MKNKNELLLPLSLAVTVMTLGAVACDAESRHPAARQAQITRVTRNENMKVIIGSKAFNATLADNP